MTVAFKGKRIPSLGRRKWPSTIYSKEHFSGLLGAFGGFNGQNVETREDCYANHTETDYMNSGVRVVPDGPHLRLHWRSSLFRGKGKKQNNNLRKYKQGVMEILSLRQISSLHGSGNFIIGASKCFTGLDRKDHDHGTRTS